MKYGKPIKIQRVWLTTRDAADYLGVSTDFIRRLIADDDLKMYKVRHTLFVRKDELDTLIEGSRI